MKNIEAKIIQSLNVTSVVSINTIQELWSGYGYIYRCYIEGFKASSIIVKHIEFPDQTNHPRGWNTEFSHKRKIKSYYVESSWYLSQVKLSHDDWKIPELYYSSSQDNEIFLILEDLNAVGFSLRKSRVTLEEMKNCLVWLANFHGTMFGEKPKNLWRIGTYWHLTTRPDEYKAMKNKSLKNAAYAIDEKLNQATYKTLVHGDAKVANFCFSENGRVAAVDFQYVGEGCGIKDVVYFISSCLNEDECQQYELELLDYYFNQLEVALKGSLISNEIHLLIDEWRFLYKYAWADFCRFLDGWSPGHWKMHSYSTNLTNEVINELNLK
ncbi:oxidoreductase family protein [Reichenbachiella versicolor]|uniref:oxidoreductase family protein n=1 Tax=Reichenbachiella versicolor TaxID=1821036 RepID=UPI000D6E1360|nr:oxidoreductase family protein [Reichenbachiella versicolor]